MLTESERKQRRSNSGFQESHGYILFQIKLQLFLEYKSFFTISIKT